MKRLVCVFAHPDDEAMGPGGTVAKLAQEAEVYLICATAGNAGDSADSKALGKLRQEDLRAAAKILGVKKVDFLGFDDGQLCNNLYHNLANKIEERVRDYQPETLLTFELNGVTGHLDHIAVSLATSFVFQKLAFVKTLMYFCLDKSLQENWAKDYFIYIPPGHTETEVDEVVDVSSVWQQKFDAISAHQSQKEDVERILNL